MLVSTKTPAATGKKVSKPKAIGRKKAVIDPSPAPTASMAKTARGLWEACSKRAGKKLPVTKATGASRRIVAVGERVGCRKRSRMQKIEPINWNRGRRRTEMKMLPSPERTRKLMAPRTRAS